MNFFSLTCEKGVRTWEANQQNEINVMAHRILIDNLDAVSLVALDGGFCYKGKLLPAAWLWDAQELRVADAMPPCRYC